MSLEWYLRTIEFILKKFKGVSTVSFITMEHNALMLYVIATCVLVLIFNQYLLSKSVFQAFTFTIS